MIFQKEKPNEFSTIKKVIAIMSGKGGVGKSSVTSLIASLVQDQGYKVGIMDADITGPSIPRIFGINKERADRNNKYIDPVETSSGIKTISINLLLDNEESPVIWRGPILNNTVKQFFSHVNWGELDYLFIDLPPGTGDIPLTIMQVIPIDGIIVVTSPQELVKLIVKKSVKMASSLDIPLLGIVENMSYFQCPHCDEKTEIFGKSLIEGITQEMDLELISKLPIDPKLVEMSDEGKIEEYIQNQKDQYEEFIQNILKIL
ncbi:Mrp/NBP35 family ATP-binding protein [Irregularibacter muris]|uniref:Iron-sulfur cluster carrier protein n=1 Tax=Irregularibacter muris TaxID=1796619 RepID=A0AAE3HEJ3_9FIRM|nr:Mrp/NBP35 family ATP-binding protein [Irregularibacter muris]MCR1897673.1 Mrp/NBP35 family ATP-binding protein [Irregularibacter muris]